MSKMESKVPARKTSPAHVHDDQTLKGTKNPSLKSTNKTDSSNSMSFDSNLDCGYKSGELTESTSGSNRTKTVSRTLSQSLGKEHSIRFDSGLGADCFSPLSSETDIYYPVEDETFNTKTSSLETLKVVPSRFLWQDIYSQDQDGDTILHLAVVEARSDVIFPLIRQAPHPDFLDICNDLCQTPLHLATLTGKSNIVRRLVVAGATLDIEDHHGNTSLHIASRNGDFDCVLAILEPLTAVEITEAQCPYNIYPQPSELSYLINMKNYDGQTSIHLAALGGFKKALECLYDHGANINDQEGKSGKTALHYAVENINLDLVEILIAKCRANTSTRNYAGQTPLRVAWTLCRANPQKSRISIMDLLKKNSTEKWESPSDSDSETSSSDEKDTSENHSNFTRSSTDHL